MIAMHSANTVHRRTLKGQMAASAVAPQLDQAGTMLLRLFNGFTPTDLLVQMASRRVARARAIVDDLERLGLIEPVG